MCFHVVSFQPNIRLYHVTSFMLFVFVLPFIVEILICAVFLDLLSTCPFAHSHSLALFLCFNVIIITYCSNKWMFGGVDIYYRAPVTQLCPNWNCAVDFAIFVRTNLFSHRLVNLTVYRPYSSSSTWIHFILVFFCHLSLFFRIQFNMAIISLFSLRWYVFFFGAYVICVILCYSFFIVPSSYRVHVQLLLSYRISHPVVNREKFIEIIESI